MKLYDKEHLRKLREECSKMGLGYLSDKGLIEFDKAMRLRFKEQFKK